MARLFQFILQRKGFQSSTCDSKRGESLKHEVNSPGLNPFQSCLISEMDKGLDPGMVTNIKENYIQCKATLNWLGNKRVDIQPVLTEDVICMLCLGSKIEFLKLTFNTDPHKIATKKIWKLMINHNIVCFLNWRAKKNLLKVGNLRKKAHKHSTVTCFRKRKIFTL